MPNWGYSAFRHDPLKLVGFRLPRTLAEQIDRHCRQTGEGKSAFARRVFAAAVRQPAEGPGVSDQERAA